MVGGRPVGEGDVGARQQEPGEIDTCAPISDDDCSGLARRRRGGGVYAEQQLKIKTSRLSLTGRIKRPARHLEPPDSPQTSFGHTADNRGRLCPAWLTVDLSALTTVSASDR